MFGGKPGHVAQYFLLRGGQEIPLGSKTTIQIEPGDVISFRTCGGGGYGSPFERDPQSVLRDVREGKVNIERARVEYGVVLEKNGQSVDEIATKELRARAKRN